MDTMLERIPFGLRLEYIVWQAAFRDEFLNLAPHPWVAEVAVFRLILLDRERLIVIDQLADGATDGRRATRDKGIRKLPHFLGPLREQLSTGHLGSAQQKTMWPAGNVGNRVTAVCCTVGPLAGAKRTFKHPKIYEI